MKLLNLRKLKLNKFKHRLKLNKFKHGVRPYKVKHNKYIYKPKLNKLRFIKFKTDPLVLKMVNLLMKNGKKEKAEKIFRRIFSYIEENYPGEALNIFYLAVFYTQYTMGARLKIKGKKSRRKINTVKTYVPYYLSAARSQTLVIRSLFILGINRSVSGLIWENLSEQFIEAAFNKGEVVAAKYQTHKFVKDNKRFRSSYLIRKYAKKPKKLSRKI